MRLPKGSLLFLVALLYFPLFAVAEGEDHVIQIRPTKFVARIAVPNFNSQIPGEAFRPGTFSDIIYRDLELSGFFLRPENEKFVAQTDRSDKTRGKIDFTEWKRLGCSFLLKGEYHLTDSDLWADCYLYDTKTGQRVFGKKFKGYTKQAYRLLAHHVSDEIVHYVAHEKGVASTRIVFISKRGDSKEVYIMDADGFNQRSLTNDGSLAATPCWGYGGTEIYYTSYKEYNPDLWVLRLKDGKRGVVSSYPGFNLSSAWCEKTKRIALTLSKDGNSEIYTMDHRGNSLKRLTFNRAIDSSPSWSPHGNRIVFTSDRSGGPQLYVMDSEGLDVKRLTRQGSYSDSAVWSPKGDKIAFVSRSSGYFHVFLMNMDGTDWIQLTKGQSNNEDPSWAPNGHHIVFTSDRTGKPQIFIMNDDGSNQVQLTTQGSNQSPGWSPFF